VSTSGPLVRLPGLRPVPRSLGPALLLVLALAACSTLPERRPVPPERVGLAVLPGLAPGIRFLGDEAPPDLAQRLEQARERARTSPPEAWRGPQRYLALSGGGPFGAFGAGLLAGWTEHGDRPEFTIVTGISAGALIAPFAFLGPDYDSRLADVFTSYATADLLDRRGILRILTGDAVADTAGLQALIGQYLDEAAIDRIAAEQRRGRQLWVGTTNLDLARPVIWDITAIAASGHPDRAELIHKILLGSASIPGAFPPVYFDVEADGKRHDELHVDGGITAPVFLYPNALNFREILDIFGVREPPHVYVVANMPLAPIVDPVEPPSIFEISARSTLALIRTQTVGTISTMYQDAQRDGLDFSLAYIPSDFTQRPEEPFDPVFMGALFERGRAMGKAGFPWLTTPIEIGSARRDGVPAPVAHAPVPVASPR